MPRQQSNATDQATPKAGRGGVVPPVDKQFGQPNGNPRNPGGWVKSDTPRFKLEQMMKLSETELLKVYENTDAPLFERKLARAIKDGDWKVIKEMTEQVYGKPKEAVDVTTNGKDINPMAGLTTEELKKLAGK